MSSDPVWVPVANPHLGHWQVRVLRVRVGDEAFGHCEDGQCTAVVDSGTSLVGAPPLLAQELVGRLAGGEAAGPEDCEAMAGKSLHFELEGVTISLEPREYTRYEEIVVTEDLTGQVLRGMCQPLLMTLDVADISPKLFIFGEPVLRKYYTAFDFQGQQIGFSLRSD